MNKKSSVASMGVITGGISVLLTSFVTISANSLALWADLIATILGFLAISIAWFGFKKIETQSTVTFNYGFGKFESFSSMGMATLMILSFFCIMSVAVMRFISPVPVKGLGIIFGFFLHLVFGCINCSLLVKTIQLERMEKSSLLTSQRRFYVIKFSTNVLVIVSLFISFFFGQSKLAIYFDLLSATIITMIILLSATKILRYSVRDLLDYALEEKYQLLILRSLANHFNRYKNIHNIRTRISGGKIYVELFLEFDGDLKHAEVVETANSIQSEIKGLIHCDEVLIIPVIGEK